MKISYNWLRNYLPTDLTREAVADILTRIGLEVEGGAPYCAVRGGLEGLIVGEVLTCDPHPNADRLKLTRVSPCRLFVGLQMWPLVSMSWWQRTGLVFTRSRVSLS